MSVLWLYYMGWLPHSTNLYNILYLGPSLLRISNLCPLHKKEREREREKERKREKKKERKKESENYIFSG